MERFHRFTLFHAFQVVGKQETLLDGDLGNLRMAVRIVGFRLQADIADGEYISRTVQLVVFIDQDTSAPA